MASGFDEKALADAYAMAAGLERLAEECPEVYDYHYAENEASLHYGTPSFDGETLDFEEPTFDPRNKRGSTKKRGSDSLNSSDTGVKITPKSEIFYDEGQGCEGKYDEIDEDEVAYRKERKRKGIEKSPVAYAEDNYARGSRDMARQKKQLLRAAITDVSKDDLRRIAMALLDEG